MLVFRASRLAQLSTACIACWLTTTRRRRWLTSCHRHKSASVFTTCCEVGIELAAVFPLAIVTAAAVCLTQRPPLHNTTHNTTELVPTMGDSSPRVRISSRAVFPAAGVPREARYEVRLDFCKRLFCHTCGSAFGGSKLGRRHRLDAGLLSKGFVCSGEEEHTHCSVRAPPCVFVAKMLTI